MRRDVTIGLFGPSASGKTVFLACLLETLATETGRRLGSIHGSYTLREHPKTQEWVDAIKKQLLAGEFPAGTAVSTPLSIDFIPDSRNAKRITFHLRDFRGGNLEAADWKESNGKDINVDAMIDASDALALILDSKRLRDNPADFQTTFYADVLTNSRESREELVPVRVLWAKSDEVPEQEFQAAVAQNQSCKKLWEQLAAGGGHEWRQLHVSCLKLEGGRPVVRPGNGVFWPDNVAEALEQLAGEVWARRTKGRAKRVASAVATLAMIGIGALAYARSTERGSLDQLQRELAAPSITDLDAIGRIEAFDDRWRSKLLWMLPSDRRDMRALQGELADRREGHRRERRAFIVQTAASEAPDVARQDAGFYQQKRQAADEYIAMFGSEEMEVVEARARFDEKARYREALAAISGVPAADVRAWMDKVVSEQAFPHLEAQLRSIRDGHHRRLQEEGVTQDFQATRVAVNGLSEDQQRLEAWQAFLSRHPGNPIRPADSSEALAWDRTVREAQGEVGRLEVAVRASSHEAALRQAASAAAAAALRIAGPLTQGSIQQFRNALGTIGAGADARRVMERWETLAFGDVRSAFEVFLAAPSPGGISAVLPAIERYRIGIASRLPPTANRSYVDDVARFSHWAQSVRGVNLAIQQSGNLHVEIQGADFARNTVRVRPPISIALPAAALFQEVTIRYRYMTRQSITTVATETVNLLTGPDRFERSYRGDRVSIQVGPARPPLPRHGSRQ